MTSLSLGLTLGGRGSGGPATTGPVSAAGLVSQVVLGDASAFVTELALPGLVADVVLGSADVTDNISLPGLAADAVLGSASVFVTELALPGLAANVALGAPSVLGLSITENGSGTYDVTLVDGESQFTVTIADSDATHQNGTWGPFDVVDLDSGPINIVAAKITGTTGLGDELTAAPGVWVWDTANGTATVTANWQRDASDISGETGSTYTIAAADESTALTYLETADDDVAGTVTEPSNTINVGVFAAAGTLVFDATTTNEAFDGGSASSTTNEVLDFAA